MQLLQGTPIYDPSIATVEQQTVFNLEALMKGIYEQPSSVQYPHSFTEAESVYAMPVISYRQIPTPSNGMRRIYVVSFQILPGSSLSPDGVWKSVLPMSGDLIL